MLALGFGNDHMSVLQAGPDKERCGSDCDTKCSQRMESTCNHQTRWNGCKCWCNTARGGVDYVIMNCKLMNWYRARVKATKKKRNDPWDSPYAAGIRGF